MNTISNVVLASNSPRRKELLKKTNLSFISITPNIEEIFVDNPYQTVKDTAIKKAYAVKDNALTKNKVIISADTLVTIDNKLLGKPKSKKEAYDMLQLLSDGWHQVITGLCVVDFSKGNKYVEVETTDVLFAKLDERLIQAYIATEEPLDKAGAYGIQGLAEMFISKINGSYSNVIGLPLDLLRNMLKNFNIEMLPVKQ